MVIPAYAGIQGVLRLWIPADAGMPFPLCLYCTSIPRAERSTCITRSRRLDGRDPEACGHAWRRRVGGDQTTLTPTLRDLLFANDFQALAAAQQDSPSLEGIIPPMTRPCLLYAGENEATCYTREH